MGIVLSVGREVYNVVGLQTEKSRITRTCVRTDIDTHPRQRSCVSTKKTQRKIMSTITRVREVPDYIANNQTMRLLEQVEKVINAQNVRTIGSRDFGDDIDPRRNLADECGYPRSGTITLEDYRRQYRRNPIAKKVVDLLPDHSWQVYPTIFEDETSENDTPFEEAVKDLGNRLVEESWYQDSEGDPVWEYLGRVDRISGINHYSTLLIGVGGEEGQDLSQPLEFRPDDSVNRELIYLRAFPEYLSMITDYEKDPSNPRFRLPTTYNMSFDDTEDVSHTAVSVGAGQTAVHWTRVVHVTDQIMSNEVLATPRMLSVFNRLLDLDKVYGGSAEMYWKGAFPGISFETIPQLGADVEVDTSDIQSMMEKYQNGLQRYLLTTGMHANSLAPQVVDPSPLINAHLEAICVDQSCPKRIFMGSERGQLASGQDRYQWDNVITSRRNNYVTPKIIVPVTNRFIQLGILPRPKGFSVSWPEIETLSELEKAEVANKLTQAIIAYVAGDGVTVMPLPMFLTLVLGFTAKESDAIIDILDKEGMEDRLIESALVDDSEQEDPQAKKLQEQVSNLIN